ncbi:ATP-binding cassette domain-containing protein [Aliarcobacter butzleri]|uniref:ATP-binding cassette domain-containing protein n=1 Tax=Aliarcobacter butzleri TaxID=28197 RepID=UPI002B24D449|nr:ATP-binding cassette domain-containing protein [Aliarcobacter butzleri]
MQHLQINNLTFKYRDTDIFTNLTLSFEPFSWNCIVGNNGSGKTTLLKLIAKKIKPESGNIVGNDLVYYCEQNLDKTPDGFEEFIYTFNSKTFRLKELLHIQDEWFYRWKTLSYGEKKRVQIAIALYQEIDVLLLDEPTNHLDYKSKNIVLGALKSFRGIGILVSHDRELLNTLCTNTVIIKNQNVYSYKSSYDTAIKELNQYRSFLQKENENINKELKKLQKNIQTQKEKVSLSKSRLSKKSIDKSDKDAKEKINLAKLTGKDKNDSKLVSTFSKKYEEQISKRNNIDKEFEKGIKIENNISKKDLFSFYLEEGSLKLSQEKILYYPSLTINSTDKIVIVGDNGVGKSSFLKHIISKIDLNNNYLYLPQEIEKNQIKKLYEGIASFDNDKKGLLYTFVRRLSSNPKNLLENRFASPGEIRKLFIAKALLENISLIILDEPTNHMDIDSIEALEKALVVYDKALIVVSHDKTFIKNLNLEVWNVLKTDDKNFFITK